MEEGAAATSGTRAFVMLVPKRRSVARHRIIRLPRWHRRMAANPDAWDSTSDGRTTTMYLNGKPVGTYTKEGKGDFEVRVRGSYWGRAGSRLGAREAIKEAVSDGRAARTR